MENVNFLKVRIRHDALQRPLHRKASWMVALATGDAVADEDELRDAAAHAIQSIFKAKAAQREHGFKLPPDYLRTNSDLPALTLVG